MRGRDPHEPHRAATPIELFFDLCFVVAVAQAAVALHHELADGHLIEGAVAYLMVFFAIWWAWMGFTWFASAYDTDDVLYRLLTFVQIAGVLIIAAGVPRAFEGSDFVTMTVGYSVMRIGLVAQWLRAAAEHPDGRATALRYAGGVTAVQVFWLARLLLPHDVATISFAAGVGLELAVPLWAERAGRTPWHAHHVTERYGLFTIIVLGECVLAVTVAIQEAIAAGGVTSALALLAAGAFVLLGAMWWAYFKHNAAEELVLTERNNFVWGYGHYLVFAALAAVGAGLQVAVDRTHEEVAISGTVAALAVAVPVAVYLLTLWAVSLTGQPLRLLWPIAAAAGASVVVALLTGGNVPLAVALMGAAVAAVVGISAWRASRPTGPISPEPRGAS